MHTNIRGQDLNVTINLIVNTTKYLKSILSDLNLFDQSQAD